MTLANATLDTGAHSGPEVAPHWHFLLSLEMSEGSAHSSFSASKNSKVSTALRIPMWTCYPQLPLRWAEASFVPESHGLESMEASQFWSIDLSKALCLLGGLEWVGATWSLLRKVRYPSQVPRRDFLIDFHQASGPDNNIWHFRHDVQWSRDVR